MSEEKRLVYLDNASTVYPKPGEVLDGMVELYRKYGVNPGRSGYDICLRASDLVKETRRKLADFFGAPNPERLCFAYNASDALNTIINGVMEEGDHAVTTIVEHNSVIRPLNHLKKEGKIEVDFVSTDTNGKVNPGDIGKRFKKNTRLVVVNHGSNVLGTVQDLREIGKLCRENDVIFLVDTAQTAGVVDININEMYIDAIAFTGHKSLLGPTGIGGLYVSENVDVKATRSGGTGIASAYPFQVEEYPNHLEVGTLNLLGIAGLNLAHDYISKKGMGNIYREEMELFEKLYEGLSEINKVKIYGPGTGAYRVPVLSFNIEGMSPEEAGARLNLDYNIATRTGLHCAPLIHERLGTAPQGTIRMSIGPMNTVEDIEQALRAVEEISMEVA